jgi:curli production assembly/transport component CsgE
MLQAHRMIALLLRAVAATAIAAAALTAWADSEPAPADEKNSRTTRNVQRDPYAGVVVNQTITVAGQNFYQAFVTYWRDKEMSERFAISIHERPSVRWGTQVWIEYAQKPVFQAALPSSVANIKALSEQAAEIAQQKVIDVEMDRLLFRESEFGPDEI